MIRYIIQRVLLLIPTMIGITLISFLIMHLAPGDPVELFLGGLAGGEGIATDEPSDLEKTREDLRRQLGLDKPIHVQYLSWLSNLLLRVERPERIRADGAACGSRAGRPRARYTRCARRAG